MLPVQLNVYTTGLLDHEDFAAWSDSTEQVDDIVDDPRMGQVAGDTQEVVAGSFRDVTVAEVEAEKRCVRFLVDRQFVASRTGAWPVERLAVPPLANGGPCYSCCACDSRQ
ncbi:hypothetical protein [Nocardioides sp. NPDC004968]|uniref:hypothetical protein n=1 Tax=Nocardioides sp. NPDC004968 TaxID=3155894 RepID=UPI0033B6D499